jgi:hypothetical protein
VLGALAARDGATAVYRRATISVVFQRGQRRVTGSSARVRLTHVVSAKPATGGTIRPRTFSLGDSFGDPGPYLASDEGYAPFLAFIAFGNSHRLRKFLFVRHPDDLARTEIANFMTSPIQRAQCRFFNSKIAHVCLHVAMLQHGHRSSLISGLFWQLLCNEPETVSFIRVSLLLSQCMRWMPWHRLDGCSKSFS